MKITGLVLAGGASSRMGQPKALLLYKGASFLERVSRALKESETCSEILVVTGFHELAVAAEARRLGLRTIHNPLAHLGLLTSLQAGLSSVGFATRFGANSNGAKLSEQSLESTPEARAVLVVPVDQPLLTSQLIREFVTTSRGRSLARVFYNGKPGHPCLIGQQHFHTIIGRTPSDEGAAFLFRQNPESVFRFDAQSAEMGRDIDTMEEFFELVGESDHRFRKLKTERQSET